MDIFEASEKLGKPNKPKKSIGQPYNPFLHQTGPHTIPEGKVTRIPLKKSHSFLYILFFLLILAAAFYLGLSIIEKDREDLRKMTKIQAEKTRDLQFVYSSLYNNLQNNIGQSLRTSHDLIANYYEERVDLDRDLYNNNQQIVHSMQQIPLFFLYSSKYGFAEISMDFFRQSVLYWDYLLSFSKSEEALNSSLAGILNSVPASQQSDDFFQDSSKFLINDENIDNLKQAISLIKNQLSHKTPVGLLAAEELRQVNNRHLNIILGILEEMSAEGQTLERNMLLKEAFEQKTEEVEGKKIELVKTELLEPSSQIRDEWHGFSQQLAEPYLREIIGAIQVGRVKL